MSPAYSLIISCHFIDDWSVVGDRYKCIVAEVLNPEIVEVTAIRGAHSSGRSNIDVESFEVTYDGVIGAFPKKLETFFPNLIDIRLAKSGLTTLSSADLTPWPKLKAFTAHHESIKTIDGDLFKNSPSLTWINLSDNLIRNVGAGLLSNLNELEHINLANNPCTNSYARTPKEIEDLKVELISQCPPLGNTGELEISTVAVNVS